MVLEKAITNLVSIERAFIWGIYILAIIGFGILGSILSNRFRTLHLIYYWMLFGILTSPVLVLLFNPTLTNASIVAFFSGASFGSGVPSTLSYYGDSLPIENRGRSAGIILLGTNLGAPFLHVIAKMANLMINLAALTSWRLLGLILIYFLKIQERKGERRVISFSSILYDRVFILFLAPWLMFCIIDSFETMILQGTLEANFYSFMLTVEAILGSVFAFIGGWLCDIIGRKRVVIYGFVALGLAYAVITIFPSTFAWYLYFVIDGFSAGMLWVAFILIIWADLSQHGGREKYYAIGGIPYFAAPLVRLLLAPFVQIPAYAAFSIASFFLFLAVIPLMYAPETLPEKKLEARKLKQYIEEAKKIKEKHTKKSSKL